MIDYSSIKVKYTTGDTFTLGGSSYTGYFNVLSGIVYEGRQQQDTILNLVNTFKSDVYASTLLFDRLIKTDLVLPYSLLETQVPVNEYVTGRVLNDILHKIDFNTLYLYSRMLSYDNVLPENVVSTIGITSSAQSTLTWFTPTPTTNLSSFHTNTKFSDIGSFIDVHASFYSNEQYFTLYGCTSSHFLTLTGSTTNNSIGILYKTNLIRDDVNNIKTYSNITDVLLNGDDFYVIDNGDSAVYKYDVSKLQHVPALSSRIYLTSAGGNYVGTTLLYKPQFITTFNKINVVVYDVAVRRFVVMDSDFNVIQKRALTLRTETVLNIGYNHYYNTLYIVTSIGNDIYVTVVDSNMIKQARYKLEETLVTGEVVKTIQFSYNDSNIYYIVTNYRVMKRLVSESLQAARAIGGYLPGLFSSVTNTMSSFVKWREASGGTFIWNTNIFQWEWVTKSSSDTSVNAIDPNAIFTGFTIFPSVSAFDNIITTSYNSITLQHEPNSFVRIIDNENITNYNISDVRINTDQYVQSNYINAQLYKCLKNIITLKNEFLGKFNTVYLPTTTLVEDQFGVITVSTDLTLYGYKYITNYNFITIDNINDLFLHENERVTPLSINRCLSFIYNIQQNLLDSSSINIDNVAIYATESQELALS